MPQSLEDKFVNEVNKDKNYYNDYLKLYKDKDEDDKKIRQFVREFTLVPYIILNDINKGSLLKDIHDAFKDRIDELKNIMVTFKYIKDFKSLYSLLKVNIEFIQSKINVKEEFNNRSLLEIYLGTAENVLSMMDRDKYIYVVGEDPKKFFSLLNANLLLREQPLHTQSARIERSRHPTIPRPKSASVNRSHSDEEYNEEYDGGKSKKSHIKYDNKKRKVYGKSKEKYIVIDKKNILLSSIKGKYKYC